MARHIEQPQMEIGQASIAEIRFDVKSRDDIPKILKGLQYIYLTDSIRDPIFKLLEEKVLPGVDKKNGRPGMALWKILVMGVLRLDLNCDYDRLQELVNQHKTVRKMLGHADIFDEAQYNLQTIKDNVGLLTPELLEAINQIIVKAGHELLGKKKENELLRGRCDSFVLETHVHYPTDINLLYDAVRKVIQLTAQLSKKHQLSDWRQYVYNVKQVKKQMRIVQKKKRATGKSEVQKAKCEQAMKQAHQELIELGQYFLNKSEKTLGKIGQSNACMSTSDLALIECIHCFTKHAEASCSFDKGFHCSENQRMLSEELEVVALKRKGKLSQKAQAIESSDAFKKAKHKHSAVESAINALEVHGLDKCPDHGIGGLKRYVALAVVTRNIHRIGAILTQREQAKVARLRKRNRDAPFLLAA